MIDHLETDKSQYFAKSDFNNVHPSRLLSEASNVQRSSNQSPLLKVDLLACTLGKLPLARVCHRDTIRNSSFPVTLHLPRLRVSFVPILKETSPLVP